MSKLHGLISGALISVFIFFLYTLDNSISVMASHTLQIQHLTEEIKMVRNYKEYNKVKSNNYISAYANISSVFKNPMQFALFFLYKNESLTLVSKKDEKNILAFLSKYANNRFAKSAIYKIEAKILNLFKDTSEVANMAVDMLTTIIRRLNFDSILYPQNTSKIVKDWYQINKFILKKHLILQEDIECLVEFINLYKLSEIIYL